MPDGSPNYIITPMEFANNLKRLLDRNPDLRIKHLALFLYKNKKWIKDKLSLVVDDFSPYEVSSMLDNKFLVLEEVRKRNPDILTKQFNTLMEHNNHVY